eukprot:TRINITY_DN3339_c0_g1_i1.p1 TRINITY_DN3339_c0_g1~~TRINITY_DN3339_c0_g1_i1.p1  ORF type:complete len:832 (+),score=171.60 TRINITY_DN3339_c0_g1_i1:92-2497(+)
MVCQMRGALLTPGPPAAGAAWFGYLEQAWTCGGVFYNVHGTVRLGTATHMADEPKASETPRRSDAVAAGSDVSRCSASSEGTTEGSPGNTTQFTSPQPSSSPTTTTISRQTRSGATILQLVAELAKWVKQLQMDVSSLEPLQSTAEQLRAPLLSCIGLLEAECGRGAASRCGSPASRAPPSSAGLPTRSLTSPSPPRGPSRAEGLACDHASAGSPPECALESSVGLGVTSEAPLAVPQAAQNHDNALIHPVVAEGSASILKHMDAPPSQRAVRGRSASTGRGRWASQRDELVHDLQSRVWDLESELAEALRRAEALQSTVRDAAAAQHAAQRRHARSVMRVEQLEGVTAHLQGCLQSLAQEHASALRRAEALESNNRDAAAAQHAAQEGWAESETRAQRAELQLQKLEAQHATAQLEAQHTAAQFETQHAAALQRVDGLGAASCTQVEGAAQPGVTTTEAVSGAAPHVGGAEAAVGDTDELPSAAPTAPCPGHDDSADAHQDAEADEQRRVPSADSLRFDRGFHEDYPIEELGPALFKHHELLEGLSEQKVAAFFRKIRTYCDEEGTVPNHAKGGGRSHQSEKRCSDRLVSMHLFLTELAKQLLFRKHQVLAAMLAAVVVNCGRFHISSAAAAGKYEWERVGHMVTELVEEHPESGTILSIVQASVYADETATYAAHGQELLVDCCNMFLSWVVDDLEVKVLLSQLTRLVAWAAWLKEPGTHLEWRKLYSRPQSRGVLRKLEGIGEKLDSTRKNAVFCQRHVVPIATALAQISPHLKWAENGAVALARYYAAAGAANAGAG